MRPRFLALGLLAGALACSDGTGPDALEFSDINGSWTFAFSKRPDCFGTQEVELFAILDFTGSGSTGSTVSVWTDDPDEPERFRLTGQLHLDTGALELDFEHPRGEIELEGEVEQDGTFTGVALDGGCLYDVTGQRG